MRLFQYVCDSNIQADVKSTRGREQPFFVKILKRHNLSTNYTAVC